MIVNKGVSTILEVYSVQCTPIDVNRDVLIPEGQYWRGATEQDVKRDELQYLQLMSIESPLLQKY